MSKIEHIEVPFALPPRRFEDPEPLPSSGYQYEDKEYIHESLCRRKIKLLKLSD